MVIEGLLSTKSLKRHAFFMTIFSFIVSSIAMWTAYFTFPTHTSILTIAFITIAMITAIHKIFVDAEHIQERLKNKLVIHRYLIAIYCFLSLGIILSFITWYLILPAENSDVCFTKELCIGSISRDMVFQEQLTTIRGIENLKGQLIGRAIGVTSCAKNTGCWFNVIFSNNLFVMVMEIIFSTLYGAGAIFLISWNSSVVAVAIAERIITQPFVFLGFIPHGIPEFIGYFSAAIAGGLFSIIVTKHRMPRIVALHMLVEVSIFVLLALISIWIGAIIEAHIIAGDQWIATYLSAAYVIGIALFVLGLGKKESYEKEIKKISATLNNPKSRNNS